MTALLEVRELSASYGRLKVLHNVSLKIEKGSIVTLLGANGAGKTTLLRAICNLMVKVEGSVRWEGEDIARAPTAKIVQRGIAQVPEGRGTFGDLTVEENLRIGAYAQRARSSMAAGLERAFTFFPRLKERRYQQAGTLSGGEQQMLAISRALMLQPKLLLLDEPSFGLAPKIIAEIFQILRRVNAEEQVSILLVEQNATLALELASHAYLLEVGKMVMDGPSKQIASDETVQRVYLGH